MLDAIQTAIFDLLENDSRLLTCLPTDFAGVRRCKNSPLFGGADSNHDPAQGYVNLFDWSFEPNDNTMKPAVYCGMRGLESIDSKDSFMPEVNGNMINYRIARIPIVIVSDVPDRLTARLWKNQLRVNIQEILLYSDNIQTVNWNLITIDTPSQARSINTGGGAMQINRSQIDFFIEAHYGQIRGNLTA